MKIQINVEDDTILNTFISSIGYSRRTWAESICTCTTSIGKPAYEVTESSDEERNPRVFIVDHDDLARAAGLMAERYPRHFADMLTMRGDALTGDILLQLATFGEVKYQ